MKNQRDLHACFSLFFPVPVVHNHHRHFTGEWGFANLIRSPSILPLSSRASILLKLCSNYLAPVLIDVSVSP